MQTADVGTFTCRRGDAFALPFLAELDAAGQKVNLASYGPTWTAQLRTQGAAADPAAVFTVDVANIAGAVDPGPDARQLILSLTGAQTALLEARTYVFDVQVIGGAQSPLTVYAGQLQIVQDVTRA